MDYCMPTPSERAALLRLLEEYDALRLRILRCLEAMQAEWSEELKNPPYDEWLENDFGEDAAERLDNLEHWMLHLEYPRIEPSDIEDLEYVYRDTEK